MSLNFLPCLLIFLTSLVLSQPIISKLTVWGGRGTSITSSFRIKTFDGVVKSPPSTDAELEVEGCFRLESISNRLVGEPFPTTVLTDHYSAVGCKGMLAKTRRRRHGPLVRFKIQIYQAFLTFRRLYQKFHH